MEHRTKRNHPLHELISDFEAMSQTGNVSYLEEHAFYQLINYYEDERQLNKAIEAADYAARQYTFSADFLIIKARLLLAKNKPYLALKQLARAEIISPYEMDITLGRANIFCALGEYAQARSILKEAKSYSSGTDLLDLYMAEAYVFEKMRDYDQMFKKLAKVLKIDTSYEPALERIWSCVELCKKYEDSVDLHNFLIDQNPYSYLAWFNLGHAYAGLQEYDYAIDSMEYSFLIDPTFEDGYIDCAELCCQKQYYRRALEIYLDYTEVFGEEVEILVKMAECQIELAHYKDAKKILIQALKFDQHNDEIYYFLGQCFAHQKQYKNAVSAFIKAIGIEKDREEYYAELAQTYAAMGQLAKADFFFRKASKIAPEQEIYWTQHIKFLLENEALEKAIEVLDEAEYHTAGAALLYLRAVSFSKIGKRKKALKLLDEALCENFMLHTLFLDLAPEASTDKEVVSMLKYYQGERVNLFH